MIMGGACATTTGVEMTVTFGKGSAT
jgi:hypothetical protein